MLQRRADAVRDFLIENGIRAERITARGYGEEKAVESNATAEGRRENRSGVYSYEQRPERLTPPYDAMVRRNKAGWRFFETQPASSSAGATET